MLLISRSAGATVVEFITQNAAGIPTTEILYVLKRSPFSFVLMRLQQNNRREHNSQSSHNRPHHFQADHRNYDDDAATGRSSGTTGLHPADTRRPDALRIHHDRRKR